MKKLLILMAAVGICSACCIYQKYEPQQDAPKQLLGQNEAVKKADTSSNIGTLAWQSLFTDPQLQLLVKRVLDKNTDMRTAHLEVAKMQASLTAAKLAYIPSLQFDPTYQYQWGNPSTHVHNYSIGVTGSWQVDIFGKLTTAKRQTQALAAQAQDIEQATRVELISATVLAYYQLVLLDEELAILEKTDSIWKIGLEMQTALMEAGKSYSTAVQQMQASIYNIHLQQLDIRKSIEASENALCLLMHETPHAISRGTISSFRVPEVVGIGVPAALLQNRPDIRAAERNVEAAFYGTRGAYAAMFPNITITGAFGINGFDPLKLAASAVASLVQPIFAQGKLQANLKIAKANQEEAQLAYEQKVLQAGVEVSEALTDCQIAKQKVSIFANQTSALAAAAEGTRHLVEQGKANYLEVVTAQEKLLEAQIQQATNHYNAIRSVVTLYVSLGGGK